LERAFRPAFQLRRSALQTDRRDKEVRPNQRAGIAGSEVFVGSPNSLAPQPRPGASFEDLRAGFLQMGLL
jgi:hypothetical protein